MRGLGINYKKIENGFTCEIPSEIFFNRKFLDAYSFFIIIWIILCFLGFGIYDLYTRRVNTVRLQLLAYVISLIPVFIFVFIIEIKANVFVSEKGIEIKGKKRFCIF